MSTYSGAFGKGFQLKALAVMVRETTFLQQYHDTLSAEYFEDAGMRNVAMAVLSYFRRYKKAPDPSLVTSLVDEHIRRYRVAHDIAVSMVDLASKVQVMDLSDARYVKDKIVEFAQLQAVKHALGRTVDMLESGGVESIPKTKEVLDEAYNIGTRADDLGIDLIDVFPRLSDYLKEFETYDEGRKVPTGLPAIDKALGGGPSAGELCVVMGYAGVGKSVSLINFAAVAIHFLCKPVFYYTLELKKVDVILRMAARLTQCTMRSIIENEPHFQRKALEYTARNPYFKVQYYNPGTITVGALRSHLSRCMAISGIQPGLVIVDYADKLQGEKYQGESYHELGNIYDGLVGLAQDFKCPVWTASQVRRGDKSEDTEHLLDKDAAADSFKKVANSDVVVTFNQTDREHRQGRVRFYAAKVRRGEDLLVSTCGINYPKMYIWELGAANPTAGE